MLWRDVFSLTGVLPKVNINRDVLPAGKAGEAVTPLHLEGICAQYALQYAVNSKSLGKHDLVVRFLRGVTRLSPLRPRFIPSWDLSQVLKVLQSASVDPLGSVELSVLSLRTDSLLAKPALSSARHTRMLS